MIVVVGERYNLGRDWTPRDRARETDLRFLVRLGAFRKGTSRRCLVKHGLAWDAALNLLMPSSRVGAWDPGRAREVASSIRVELEDTFDSIVLAGRRVPKAFGVSGEFLTVEGKYALIPHPSGLNHWWNDHVNRERAKEFFGDLVKLYHEGRLNPQGRLR
jgi:hypothetical protein